MKFENSTFIVTGGASGLGEATVRSFHAAEVLAGMAGGPAIGEEH